MMKKIIAIMLGISLCFNTTYVVKASNENNYKVTMKQDILCLMMAYPEYITKIEKDSSEQVYIVMRSGRKILYDDKKKKSFEEKLYNTDIQDMMEQKYPLTAVNSIMNKNMDPGRFRVYPLLQEVYGGSQKQVEANLTRVNLAYKNFQFNGNNKAADFLQNAIREVIPLTHTRPDIRACVFPFSGTYNYRYIAGTNLLSPHSFGIAIDLARDNRDYWKWASKEEGQKRIESYPSDLVKIFEDNNFVWGGKWSHFDILHFEYRPEIILKARYFGEKFNNESKWYEGAPLEESYVKESIEKINKSLE